MRFEFLELPGENIARPVVPVTVEGLTNSPQLCLLDTGALHNRFGAWLADIAGIDLSDADQQRIAVGGVVTTAHEATTQLSIEGVVWDAPVWFCDPWPFPFHLLGQEGFFRWFDVRIRAAHYLVDVEDES